MSSKAFQESTIILSAPPPSTHTGDDTPPIHKVLPCFKLFQPVGPAIPLVVDSPHSGGIFPEDFHFTCSIHDLRASEDSYVDQFGAKVPQAGGTFIKALVSRAYIDLNRAVGDLHPDICDSPIPWQIHRSKRVMYGLGLIRHLIRFGEPVYDGPLPLADIKHRIQHYYHPYYEVLGQALTQAHEQFGRVLHVNIHSTPNIGVDGAPQPDIILGDHDGHSCGRIYRDTIKRYFESCGLRVVVNNPYKGVELTRRFSRPRQGYHSIQIEINKALYMDEATLAFNDTQPEMQQIMNGLWDYLAQTILAGVQMPKAAE